MMAAQPPYFLDDPRATPRKSGVVKNPKIHDDGYLNALVNKYAPNKNRIHYGYCIGYDAPSQTIRVEEDIEVTSSFVDTTQVIRTTADWGRPRLTEAEVLNKRVKISYSIQKRQIAGTYPPEYQEVKVIALYEIKPDPAPPMWEFSY